MLGLSANLNYYLFNGNVDLRKGIFRLCESIREEMSLDPSDASNVYMFMSRNRKVVKILHYERGFYVLYEKRPVMGKFKKPVFDDDFGREEVNHNSCCISNKSAKSSFVLSSILLRKFSSEGSP